MAQADSEKIFSCRSPINMFDANFEQGSEVFADLFYNPENEKSYLLNKPAEGGNVLLLKEEENTRSHINIEKSSAYFEWIVNGEETYASMAYFGGFWGMIIPVTDEMKKRDLSLKKKSELELHCKETPAFEKFFL